MIYGNGILLLVQRIIYSKNGEVVCVVDHRFTLDSDLAHYLRFIQPNTEVGERLLVPMSETKQVLTSPVDSLEIVPNALQITTMSGTEYDIL